MAQKPRDLFDWEPPPPPKRYPERPGFKEGETSREAAEQMESRAATLRALVLDYIKSNPGHTADEIAAELNESQWSIRPRVSELRKLGRIVNEGRGTNPHSGKSAHRWRVA